MKRILSLLLFVLMMSSCDPGFDQAYYFVNGSSHAVTIETLIDISDTYRLPEWSTDSITYFENLEGITVEPHSRRLLHTEGGLGVASGEFTAQNLRNTIFGDSVLFRFDDGRFLRYRYDKPAQNSPYSDSNYSFTLTEQTRGYSSGFSVYTLTDDDYLRSSPPDTLTTLLGDDRCSPLESDGTMGSGR